MMVILIDNEKHIKDEFLDETLCQIPVSKWDETFEQLSLEDVCKDCVYIIENNVHILRDWDIDNSRRI